MSLWHDANASTSAQATLSDSVKPLSPPPPHRHFASETPRDPADVLLNESLFATLSHQNVLCYSSIRTDVAEDNNHSLLLHQPPLSLFPPQPPMTTTTTTTLLSAASAMNAAPTTTTTTNTAANAATNTAAQVRPVLKRNQPTECFVVRRGAVTAKPTKRGPSPQTLFQLSALTSADLEPVTMAHVRSTALEGSFALDSDIFVVAVDESLDIPIDDVGERCRAQAHPKVVDSIGSVQRPDEDGFFYADTSQHWAPGYGQRKRAGDAEFAKWNWRPKVVNADLHGLLGRKRVRQMRRIVDNVASPCGIDAYVYVLHSGALAHKFWFLQYYRNAHGLEVKPYVAPKRSQSAKRSAPVPAAPLETQSQKMFFTASVPADGSAFFAQAAMMPPPPPSSSSAVASAQLATGAQSSDGGASSGLLSSTTAALFQSHTNGNVGSAGAFPIFSFVRSSFAAASNNGEQFGATSVGASDEQAVKRKHIAALGESAGAHAALDFFEQQQQQQQQQQRQQHGFAQSSSGSMPLRTSQSAPSLSKLGFFASHSVSNALVEREPSETAKLDAAESLGGLFLSLSIDDNEHQQHQSMGASRGALYNSNMAPTNLTETDR
jgi:hypothetical protein